MDDATNIPFGDVTFDKVSCSEALERIPIWKKAIQETRRVLKHEGLLVITTPNKKSIYGFTRSGLGSIRKMRKMLGKSKRSKHHYDVWKTQEEIPSVLEENKLEVQEKREVCFILGNLTSNCLTESRRRKLISLIPLREG